MEPNSRDVRVGKGVCREERGRGRGQRCRGRRDDPPAPGAEVPGRVDQVPGLRAERGQDGRVRGRDVHGRAADPRGLPKGSTSSSRARPASVSRQYSPIAARAGAVVVDNSSAFRMDPDVPLVVPEVNPHDVARHAGIIANPNCSTIQMVVALKPIHDAFRIRRVVVSTYQSVSGAGQKGMHELQSQAEAHVAGRPYPEPAKFAHPIAFNCIPQIDDFLAERLHQGRDEDGPRDPQDHGRRLDRRLPDLRAGARPVLATASRSSSRPSGRSPPRPRRELWSSAPGVTVVDDPAGRQYPLPASATRPRRRLRRPHPPGPRAARTPCSSGASATTSARGPPPTPSRSPRNCSKLDPVGA